MSERELFVPFGSKKIFNLFQVSFKIIPQSIEEKQKGKDKYWTIKTGGGDSYFGEKLKKLGEYFRKHYYDKTLLGEWEVKRTIGSVKPEEKYLQKTNQNTYSIVLGLFLSALKIIKYRKLNDNWDFITVTGDLIYDEQQGFFKLKEVRDIGNKFNGEFLDNAKNEKEKKHLFLYVSDTEDIEINERKYSVANNNIQVKHFTPKNQSLDDVIEFLFEPYQLKWDFVPMGLDPDDKQKELKKNLPKADYISTLELEGHVRKLSNTDSERYFIHGEGGSGKSALANALARCLLWERNIYAPVWIRLNNQDLLEVIKESKEENGRGAAVKYIDGNKIEDYLKKIILNKITNINDNKYLFVFDNLEVKDDYLKLVLTAIADIFSECDQRIIITSKFDCSNELKYKLNLVPIKPPEMRVADIERFIQVISGKFSKLQKKIDESQKTDLYNNFINLLYQNFSRSPVFIEKIVFLLSEKNINEVIKIIENFGHAEGEIQNKAVEIYKPIFYLMSHNAKVLFFWIMREKCFDKLVERSNMAVLKEPQLTDALRELSQGDLVYEEEEDNITKYAIKSHVYIPFMFNDELNGGILHDTNESYRDFIVNFDHMLDKAIEWDMPAQVVRNIIEREKKKAAHREPKEDFYLDNKLAFTAAEYSSNPETLDILEQNGCDFNYVDEDIGITPFFMAICSNPHLKIIDWFLKKGIDKKFIYAGSDALHLASGYNENPEIISLLIKNGYKLNKKTYEGIDAFWLAARHNPNVKVLDFITSQSGARFNINERYHIVTNIKENIRKLSLVDNTDIFNDDDVFGYLKFIDKNIENEELTIEFVSPVFAAIFNKNIEILEWFFKKKVKTGKDSDGNTVFNEIIRFRSDTRFLDLFKKYKVNIHERDRFGQNAFHCAAYQNESISVYDWLYTQKININQKNKKGYTPFDIAVMHNPNPKVFEWFIKKNIKKPRGFNINTYFACALYSNKEPAILQWFLDNDADIDCRDDKGNNLLHLTAINGQRRENAEWLISQNPDLLYQENYEGKTPRYYIDLRDQIK